LLINTTDSDHGRRRTSNLEGAVNRLSEISNRAGEQAVKLPQFPIVLQKICPSEKDFCPTWGGVARAPLPPTLMIVMYIGSMILLQVEPLHQE